MRPYPLNKIILVIATLLSLLAQGFVFAPARFSFILKSLPAWGNISHGAILLSLSAIGFGYIIRMSKVGAPISWTLLSIQVMTVIGALFLREGTASPPREASLLFTGAITLLTVFGISSNKFTETIDTTSSEIDIVESEPPEEPAPYIESNSQALKSQLASITRNLTGEKRRTTQLTFLNELSQQLENELDPPVAAQLAANMLERATECSLVILMLHEQDKREFVTLATAGKDTGIVSPDHRQSSEKGLLGRVARSKKTQLINDTQLDSDFLPIKNEKTLSAVIVPIMQNGQIKGLIEVCSEKPYAFRSEDVNIVEATARELTRAWERSSYDQRLTELIQAGISLATILDPQAAVQEIALLARKTLEARFVFITLLDQRGNFSRTASAGDAPKLFQALSANPAEEPLLQAALNASKPFRVRDVRKYINANNIEIDHGGLRSVLAIPIRLHRLSIGTIIAFGKQEGVFFSEKDESLADLLSSQAAAAVESSWLYQELRTTLNTTTLLYQLSLDVTQTAELSSAVELIAQAARRATKAREAGIVLLSLEGEVQVEAELDESGFHTRGKHPREIIAQAIQTGQSIFVSAEDGATVCYPLLTKARTIGALWLDIPESSGQNFANIQALASQAAVSLERTILLAESREQAKQIEAAYEELQATYDQTLSALMSALDARDRETEGHSTRVSRLACMMGEEIGLDGQQLKALERGSLLHDIGKIGISDSILHKPGKLTEDEWKIMRVHPDIGARIVERIPFLQECMPVVRYHHERWDGSGYPLGLKENDIPIQARIFAVADVFDALTSKRSYRNKSTPEEAVHYLREQANVLFDPAIVEALARLPYSDFIQAEKTSP